MTVDEDESFDSRVFDAKYWPRRVYWDGHGPRVRLMLTDSAPRSFLAVQKFYDAQYPVPSADQAREEMIRRNVEARKWGKAGLADGLRSAAIPRSAAEGDDDDDADDEDIDDAEKAHNEMIRRSTEAWKTSAVPPHLRQWAQSRADPYAKSVWSAQNAITPGSPDAAEQNEAMMRRISLTEPNATASSVEGQRRRWTAEDAAADRDAAYREYCQRISNAWKR
jgi:hypothetical protein